MRVCLGVVIWNKVDMIAWILGGIVANMRPDEGEIVLVFDNCTDDSLAAFNSMRSYWLDNRGYKTTVIVTDKQVNEVGGHLLILERFAASDCDVCAVFQDDMRLNQRFQEPLARFYADWPADKIGVVGGRDGFDPGFRNMRKAPHSQSQNAEVLAIGTWSTCRQVNSAPIFYTKPLIARIGLPDAGFYAMYIWEDYSERAHEHGLVNAVLSVDVDHVKFGRVTATNHYTPLSAGDEARFRERNRSRRK